MHGKKFEKCTAFHSSKALSFVSVERNYSYLGAVELGFENAAGQAYYEITESSKGAM